MLPGEFNHNNTCNTLGHSVIVTGTLCKTKVKLLLFPLTDAEIEYE